MLLNEAFSLYSLKISRLWEKRKSNLRTKKGYFLKSVKNILVLNIAFSKSLLVLIKNGCIAVILVRVRTTLLGTILVIQLKEMNEPVKLTRQC